MKKLNKVLMVVLAIEFMLGLAVSVVVLAAGPLTVSLGTADNFAVLAGTAITNVPTAIITGDVGLSPTTGAAIGLTTAQVTGTVYAVDAAGPAGSVNNPVLLTAAKGALATAYGDAVGRACTLDLTGQDLGGMTLTPGVYCFDTSAQLTGVLTLNAQNDPSAVFIFKIGSTLTTAVNSSVALINNGMACNVSWQVGSSATLGTTTNFKGNILALTSITLNTGAIVEGRVLAQNGAVALDTNTITRATCAPSLRLQKTVTNDNGGTALDTAWTLTATGTVALPTNLSGTTPVNSDATFKADTYTLAESGGPAGYVAGTYSCVKNGGAPVIGNSITLVAGDSAICTINNNDIAPQLHLRKVIINDNDGVAVAADFILTANGTGTNDISGTSPVDSGAGLLADTFALSETSPAGYTASNWVCVGGTQNGSNITVGLNQSATCTITNNDVAPQALRLQKTVTNDNGGTALDTAWTLTATGTVALPTNLSGTTPVNSDATFKADTYTLAESGGPAGYVASAWVCVGGVQNGSTITIATGNSATCTIDNNDVAPRLTVTKVVTNDNGSTKVIADFPLFIDGAGVTSGAANISTVGAHTVSETTASGYTSVISGDCAANGTVPLAIGDNKFCIITNDDIAPVAVQSGGGGGSYSYTPPVPPLIDVVKVPSPLALSNGPGAVTYTYTLRNIGTVPVTNMTMVGDTCSPIVLVSGDTNSDSKLDVNETWVHRCTTTLSKTHTNTVVATGWANGISTVDIASATVVVGASIVPPLIHVTKVPSPLTLSAEGGMVTYTKKVTNPGTVALSNVRVTDDKCDPVNYISGDINSNLKLEPTETWVYTCKTNLTKTTTNTAVAAGEANGLTARDFAIATVVVAAADPELPKLPSTGLPPEEKSIPWNIVIIVGILLFSSSLVLVLKKCKI